MRDLLLAKLLFHTAQPISGTDDLVNAADDLHFSMVKMSIQLAL